MKRSCTALILGFLVCLFLSGSPGMRALAQEDVFTIGAELLPSGQETYDIRVTVENHGSDWEGSARITVGSSYSYYGCAYDTPLSLPQGTTKQFMVRIPKISMDRTNGTVRIRLFDKKSQISAEKEFTGLLLGEMSSLDMGILSDDPASLSYLDLGGELLDYNGNYYPVKLVRLDQDSLAESLAPLTFLVIDRYDTGILTEEDKSSISQWVDAGGVLIVGTGSYVEDTLAGMSDHGIECHKAPSMPAAGEDLGGWGLEHIKQAELEDVNNVYDDDNIGGALAGPVGKGAVGFLPYSLSDLGHLDESVFRYGRSSLPESILYEISAEADSRYQTDKWGRSDIAYIRQGLVGLLGNADTQLNFGALKLLVIIYVIFAGPVLYLILRFMKKRELYWAAVPAAALVAILAVSLVGRGSEVKRTRVYSVTVDDLAGRASRQAYLRCFDAGHSEWSLHLLDDVTYAGPLEDTSNYGDEDGYYYHIQRDGDTLSIGADPTSSFEDSYFCAGAPTRDIPVNGTIQLDIDPGQDLDGEIPSGAVTNDTDQEFPYVALLSKGEVLLLRGFAPGQTHEIRGDVQALHFGDIDYSYTSSIRELYVRESEEDADAVTALSVGVISVNEKMDGDEIAVVVVAPSQDKVVDDDCSEISYGCFYKIW